MTGSSGSGKSTIASLILKLYEPDTGAIYFSGVASTDMSKQEVRAKIGVVEQDSVLFSGTIKENILYGRLAATQAEVRSFLGSRPDPTRPDPTRPHPTRPHPT